MVWVADRSGEVGGGGWGLRNKKNIQVKMLKAFQSNCHLRFYLCIHQKKNDLVTKPDKLLFVR